MRARLGQVAVVLATIVFGGWRYRGKVLAATIAGVALALLVAAHTTYTYGGTAQLQIGPPPGSTTATGSSLGVGASQLRDAVAIVESPQLRRDTATLLGLPVRATPVATASVLPGTDQVQVRVVDRSSKQAAADAVSYADAYVAAEQLAGVTGLETTAADLSARVAALGAKVDALDARIVAAGGPQPPTVTTPAAGGAFANEQLPDSDPAVAALEGQRDQLTDEQALLGRQALTLQSEATAFSGGGQVISGGVPDTHPVTPDRTRDGVLGGVGGLVVALAAAAVYEWRRHGAVTPRFGDPATAAAPEGAPAGTAPPVEPPGGGAPEDVRAGDTSSHPGQSGSGDGSAQDAGGRTVLLRAHVTGSEEQGTGAARFVVRPKPGGRGSD